jgi:nucleoside-diphosphate-sugar epimerase
MIHPINSLDSLNASNQIVWDVLRADEIPPTKAPGTFPSPLIPSYAVLLERAKINKVFCLVWIDVQDLALVSLRALTTPLSGHERFLVTEGPYDTQEIADVVREGLPEYRDRVPVGHPGQRSRDTHYGCDSSKVKRVLGVEFRGLRESIVPLARQLFEMERGRGSSRTDDVL